MSLLLQASTSSPVIVPCPFRGVVFSACQPLDTSSSNVRFHQSTCAWYDVGLECFCRDTSEYKDCRRDLDVVVYVEHEESDTGAEAMDGQKTRQIWPQIIDHSKSHVPLLLHLLHLFFYRSHLSTPPSGRLRMKLVAFVLLLYGFDPFSNVQGQSRSLNYAPFNMFKKSIRTFTQRSMPQKRH